MKKKNWGIRIVNGFLNNIFLDVEGKEPLFLESSTLKAEAENRARELRERIELIEQLAVLEIMGRPVKEREVVYTDEELDRL